MSPGCSAVVLKIILFDIFAASIFMPFARANCGSPYVAENQTIIALKIDDKAFGRNFIFEEITRL